MSSSQFLHKENKLVYNEILRWFKTNFSLDLKLFFNNNYTIETYSLMRGFFFYKLINDGLNTTTISVYSKFKIYRINKDLELFINSIQDNSFDLKVKDFKKNILDTSSLRIKDLK